MYTKVGRKGNPDKQRTQATNTNMYMQMLPRDTNRNSTQFSLSTCILRIHVHVYIQLHIKRHSNISSGQSWLLYATLLMHSCRVIESFCTISQPAWQFRQPCSRRRVTPGLKFKPPKIVIEYGQLQYCLPQCQNWVNSHLYLLRSTLVVVILWILWLHSMQYMDM